MYCITGPARHFQFLCYTISGGGHFPPKINDDCLPWLLSPSLFYAIDSLDTASWRNVQLYSAKNSMLIQYTLLQYYQSLYRAQNTQSQALAKKLIEALN